MKKQDEKIGKCHKAIEDYIINNPRYNLWDAIYILANFIDNERYSPNQCVEWPAKNGKEALESPEFECDSPELNQMIGWDKCHEAFMAVINSVVDEMDDRDIRLQCIIALSRNTEYVNHKKVLKPYPEIPSEKWDKNTGIPGKIKPISDLEAKIGINEPSHSWMQSLDKNKATEIFKECCSKYLESIGHSFSNPDDWPYGFREFYLALYESIGEICSRFSPSVRVVPSVEEIEDIVKIHTKGMAERQYGSGKHHCYVCREDLATAIRELLLRGE